MAYKALVTALAFGAALALSGSGTAAAMGSAHVAALQVALRAQGVYGGAVDGLDGPQTTGALRELQRRAGLPDSGVLDAPTRKALGLYGAPDLGSRTLGLGDAGWDVAELQFLLAWHGFPSGTFDGVFGAHLEAAVRRYQRWAGLPVVGYAGPATMGSLTSSSSPSCPITLSWPLQAPVGDPFGSRGARFHAGIDLIADAGMPVMAAAAGRVSYADYLAGGWGLLVVISHGDGVRSMYVHLSRVDVVVGQQVDAGTEIGLVGATGDASGPHLHFEVRVRGAAVDPMTALS